MLKRHQLKWAVEQTVKPVRYWAPERHDLMVKPDVIEEEDGFVKVAAHALWMAETVEKAEPDVMSDEKVNRWLGFIQGAVWALGCATIEELRQINLAAKAKEPERVTPEEVGLRAIDPANLISGPRPRG